MGKSADISFEPLFPHWPEDEVPIGHVTNGVHMPTWDSAPADDLVDRSLWQGALAGDDRKTWSRTFAASPTPRSGNFGLPLASLLLNTLADDSPGELAASGASAEAVDEAEAFI
jgi:glycogen phosphorylase